MNLNLEIACIDEAHLGCIAGSVYAACVVLDSEKPIEGLNDSKKLSDEKRRELAPIIKERAKVWACCSMLPDFIDANNILIANHEAMRQALSQVIQQLGHNKIQVIVDGSNIPDFHHLVPMMRVQAVVKADTKYQGVMAASILAKVAGDDEMLLLDEQYPQYFFKQHKGYGTAIHLEAIREHGFLPGIHRRSFDVKI